VNILLINSNPVVSRLFALCMRNTPIELDEAENIDNIEKDKRYDLLFVDDASGDESIKSFMENADIGKKVYIAYEPENVSDFDLVLKKPFLPSQILNIIENITAEEDFKKSEEAADFFSDEGKKSKGKIEKESIPPIFPLAGENSEKEKENTVPESPQILDSREIERIKDLLDMEEEEILPLEEDLADEVVEQRKVEAITAQLIADGLEIVEEDEIVEALHSGKKSKKRKNRGPFSKKEFDAIQKVFRKTLLEMKPKEVKKLLKGKTIKIKLKLKEEY